MIRQWLAAGVIVLSACGGGGEDGSANNGGTTPGDGSSTIDVTVALTSPATIDATVAKGRMVEAAPLTAKVSGNLALLNGKTVHVLVEDVDGLFVSTALLTGPDSAGNLTLKLFSKPLETTGDYTGTLTVRACLDPDCKTQLRGTPITVPFHVTVTAGMGLANPTLDASTVFGDPTFTRTVTGGAPAGKVSNVSWGHTPSVDGHEIITMEPGPRAQPTDPLTLNVTLGPAAPGLHVKEFSLSAQIEKPDGSTYWATETFTVRYTVADNPTIDYVLSTPSFVLDVTNPNGRDAKFWAATRPGVSMTWRGMEYLTHPAAADGLAHVSAWWNAQGGYVSGCPRLASMVNCLPAGTYTARAHYTMSKAGATTEVYLPITMNILR